LLIPHSGPAQQAEERPWPPRVAARRFQASGQTISRRGQRCSVCGPGRHDVRHEIETMMSLYAVIKSPTLLATPVLRWNINGGFFFFSLLSPRTGVPFHYIFHVCTTVSISTFPHMFPPQGVKTIADVFSLFSLL